jgi:hypothetical protein
MVGECPDMFMLSMNAPQFRPVPLLDAKRPQLLPAMTSLASTQISEEEPILLPEMEKCGHMDLSTKKTPSQLATPLDARQLHKPLDGMYQPCLQKSTVSTVSTLILQMITQRWSVSNKWDPEMKLSIN